MWVLFTYIINIPSTYDTNIVGRTKLFNIGGCLTVIMNN
jgi:hypothetical protein